jgi:hypothetical protein
MKIRWLVAITMCVFVSERIAVAQAPLGAAGERSADATVGNQVLQLRYYGSSPLSSVNSNLDYGILLTENRDFVASAAWLFDTEIPLSGLRVQVGPQAYLSWLSTGTKTDVFALALGANIRYELIHSVGFSLFGSGFYSPGVLTFGSAHNLYDFTAGAEVRLFDRLYAQAGYRWFKFTLVNEPDEKVANEVFGGVRWQLH